MATQSTTLTTDWTLIANASDAAVLAQAYGGVAQIEYMTTADNVAPDAQETGHQLLGNEQMTRLAIGAGYLWARRWGSVKMGVIVVSGSSVDFEAVDSDSESSS